MWDGEPGSQNDPRDGYIMSLRSRSQFQDAGSHFTLPGYIETEWGLEKIMSMRTNVMDGRFLSQTRTGPMETSLLRMAFWCHFKSLTFAGAAIYGTREPRPECAAERVMGIMQADLDHTVRQICIPSQKSKGSSV